MRRRTVQLALLAGHGCRTRAPDRPDSLICAQRSGSTALTKQEAIAAYGKLPLAFTANAGQTDRRVRYSAQGGGLSVFLTRKEAMLALQRPGKGVALALRFLGANPHVAIRGERLGPGRVNYLLGNDPAKWHTGLRTYERVVYRNLWPGVDMVFHGQNGTLKYEFLVRPGARVSGIRLAYRGAKRLSLDRQGNLLIRTPLGVLTDTRPVSYQLVARQARARREAVRARPRRAATASRSAAATTAATRSSSTPASLLHLPGRKRLDDGYGIAVDAAGSAYVTGNTASADFPTTAGAFDTTFNGNYDAFVTKLERERRRPRLLDLPGRKRPRLRQRASRSTAPATPT